jgi:hypothetical protein
MGLEHFFTSFLVDSGPCLRSTLVQWAEKAKNGQAQWSDRAETAQNGHSEE